MPAAGRFFGGGIDEQHSKDFRAFLTPVVIDEMACIGSVLVIALGLNMLKITNIRLANLILAPFVPIVLYAFMG